MRKYRLAIEALEPRLVLNSMGIADPFETSSMPYIASAQGVAEVAGRDLFVDVLFQVPAGANANEAALAALAAQGARPFQSADYSTTGLVWDQFFDIDSNNDLVTQNYNSANDPTGGAALDALLSGHTTWNDVSGSRFVFSYGGTTDRWPSLVRESPGKQFLDGMNDVAWMKLRGGRILGVTWYDVAADEADMALNTQFSWATNGSDSDVETVFLHENGHVLGLGHSDVTGSIMEAVYAGVRRDLHQDDIDGISSLYPVELADPLPVVEITTPGDGDPVSGTVTFTANATDDDAVTQVEFFVDSVSLGVDSNDADGWSAVWDTTLASEGSHTLTATATDSASQTASDSIDVTVDNVPDPPSTDPEMYVWEMTWSEKHRGRGGSMTDLFVTVDVNQDSVGVGFAGSDDDAAANAATTLRLTHDTDGDGFGGSDDTSWIGTATTNELGQVAFKLRLAPDGNYQAEVTGLTHATFVWDSTLDADNPDEYIGVPNGSDPFSSASSTAVLKRQSENLDAMFEEIAWFYASDQTGAIDRPGKDKHPAAEAVDYLLTYQP